MTATITTNNAFRDLVYASDVPEATLSSDFDYQDREDITDGFFKYRGQWYHIDMFMRLDHSAPSEFAGWDAYHSDSAFSGLLIKLANDREAVKVATYCS